MVLNGNAFSPPVNIRPWSPGGSQPGSPQNSGLNGTPQPHQPVEVGDAARAVVGDSVRIGTRAHRHVEERGHVVDGIVEATGLLQRCAAAEVDESAGHGGRATPGAGPFEHQDVGAGARRLDRRGRTGDAVAGDHDIGLVIPARRSSRGDGVTSVFTAQGRMAAGRSPTHWWPQ